MTSCLSLVAQHISTHSTCHRDVENVPPFSPTSTTPVQLHRIKVGP
jgi:hypothetical protein